MEIKDDTGEHVQSIYILTPSNIKKYIKEFAYQVFKLRKGNFILSECFLEKIRTAYPNIGEILVYKNDLWALVVGKKIPNYINLKGMNIRSLEGLDFFITMRKLELNCKYQQNLACLRFSIATDEALHFDDLDLSDNQISVLPESIGLFTNLSDLNLSNNKLTALPESIDQLTNLSILSLSSNKLTSLPQSLGRLTAFDLLDLSQNQLTSLPNLSSLTRLLLLNLSHNKLTTFPESLCLLINLSHLFFNNNLLDSLPPTVTQLTKLESLFLYNNNLTDNLDIQLFASLSNLHTLDLTNNKLSEEKKKAIQEKFGTKIANLTL